MAISKVVFKTSAQDTGTVWIDATSATAAASDIIAPKTAMLANGVVTTGTGSGGGGGLVYETGTYTPASDTAQPTISFQNTHTTLPILVMMADATGSYTNTTNTNHSFTFNNYYGLTGYPLNTSSTVNLYAYAHSKYRASDASNLSNNNSNVTMPPDSSQSSSNYYSYWVTTSGFKPGSNSTSRYWRSGRTYKWIAIWAPSS